MSENGWTPGPWGQHHNPIGDIEIGTGEIESDCLWSDVCVATAWSGLARDETEANANLIAAAPDMAEALEYARAIVERWCQTQGNSKAFFAETLAPIDAALAKAKQTGETE
jgi:hypothetical protein